MRPGTEKTVLPTLGFPIQKSCLKLALLQGKAESFIWLWNRVAETTAEE